MAIRSLFLSFCYIGNGARGMRIATPTLRRWFAMTPWSILQPFHFHILRHRVRQFGTVETVPYVYIILRRRVRHTRTCNARPYGFSTTMAANVLKLAGCLKDKAEQNPRCHCEERQRRGNPHSFTPHPVTRNEKMTAKPKTYVIPRQCAHCRGNLASPYAAVGVAAQ